MKLTSSLLLIPLALSIGLSSCVDVGLGGGGYSNGNGYGNGYRSGYNTYTTLPPNYNGSAYQHNGRYYSGGNYQTGNYNHQGQTYTNRYSHNGQYYYGGSHQNYAPQQRSGYNSNVNLNTPILQQNVNSQFWQGGR
ncbi:MAG: hypothetical protein JWR15_4243 [Prosthecobacter sp.]|nr:hypothetical protein [Prosthecobacter sp.]